MKNFRKICAGTVGAMSIALALGAFGCTSNTGDNTSGTAQQPEAGSTGTTQGGAVQGGSATSNQQPGTAGDTSGTGSYSGSNQQPGSMATSTPGVQGGTYGDQAGGSTTGTTMGGSSGGSTAGDTSGGSSR